MSSQKMAAQILTVASMKVSETMMMSKTGMIQPLMAMLGIFSKISILQLMMMMMMMMSRLMLLTLTSMSMTRPGCAAKVSRF